MRGNVRNGGEKHHAFPEAAETGDMAIEWEIGQSAGVALSESTLVLRVALISSELPTRPPVFRRESVSHDPVITFDYSWHLRSRADNTQIDR